MGNKYEVLYWDYEVNHKRKDKYYERSYEN